MSLLRAAVLAAGLASLGALSGCADFSFSGSKSATLTYTEDARAAYMEAIKPFRNKEWDDAKALLGEVKKLFPYSRYARLAELRLADIEFEQEKFSDALTLYRDFVQNHKNDPELEYARYRITRALFRDIEDTILLPPAEERDQATTLEAYKEIRSYLRDFPKTRYREDETYMLESVTGRLVRHELYVARYYAKRDQFEATIARCDYAVKAYPGSPLEPEALVLKGETLLKMKKIDEAREVFETVVKNYKSPFVKVAQSFLEEIKVLEAKRSRRSAAK